jgi:prepilin-type N-terminal cleavage/methylation domain-containing protein
MRHFLQQQKKQAGFTLVEALVAISILALTIGGLLNLTASGFFTIRYAKNDIVATNLVQESLEYIRNSRDTAAQQGFSWRGWVDTNFPASCASTGCIINPYTKSTTKLIALPCAGKDCEYMQYYPDKGFYAYGLGTDNVFDATSSFKTSFVRTITVKEIALSATDTQLVVTSEIKWLNGTNPKKTSQSIILSSWNLQ